jgi:ABC-type nitrate/sulfonate/bicarbonate transport system ATPase subunit
VTAPPGELLAVRGPSGSGKSSLLSLLGGITAPHSGTVTFAGRRVAVTHAAQDVGLMLQGHALAAVLTARENVEISLQARGCPPDEVAARAEAALQRVLLDGIGDRPVDRLSGGQQQRVALARAIVHGPRCCWSTSRRRSSTSRRATTSYESSSPRPSGGRSSSSRHTIPTWSPRAIASSHWSTGGMS